MHPVFSDLPHRLQRLRLAMTGKRLQRAIALHSWHWGRSWRALTRGWEERSVQQKLEPVSLPPGSRRPAWATMPLRWSLPEQMLGRARLPE